MEVSFMEEIKNSAIRIADDVIADIAIKTAQEIDGVSIVHPRLMNSIKNLVPSRANVVKGVVLTPTEAGLDITVQVSVLFGVKVQPVCSAVQQEVADAITDMTGIVVRSVNVCVVGVVVPKANCKKISKK